MNQLAKALLLAAGGVLAYNLVQTYSRVSLPDYYRDKTAIVTGGASGIGKAIVEKLIGIGTKVLAVDYNEQALVQLQEDLPLLEILPMDLVLEDAPRKILDHACSVFGNVDLLFNNAGIIFLGSFWDMTTPQIERLIAVNLIAQIRMTHAFLPYFLDKRSGVIAYTGSLSAHVYSPSHSVYTGTKGGLNNFVAALRRELPKNSGVQLTIIHPNVTLTNLAEEELFNMTKQFISLESSEEVALAFLQGIANKDKEIFVRIRDNAYKWIERLAPEYVDEQFDKLLAIDPTRKRHLSPRR
ncbi:MAG: SDR family oxidoreductase [Acidobacteria bacterium]|nr:SDR family oxidoreductase [Acidobacteriota bacterium]